jgi:hypothetical protein
MALIELDCVSLRVFVIMTPTSWQRGSLAGTASGAAPRRAFGDAESPCILRQRHRKQQEYRGPYPRLPEFKIKFCLAWNFHHMRGKGRVETLPFDPKAKPGGNLGQDVLGNAEAALLRLCTRRSESWTSETHRAAGT